MDSEILWPVRCAIHKTRMGVAQCTSCDRFICAQVKVVEADGRALCVDCARVRSDRGSLRTRRAVSTAQQVPFEGLQEPFFARYMRTVRLVFFQPRQFMEGIDPHGAVRPALIFAFLATLVGRLIAFAWSAIFFGEEYAAHVANAAQETGLSRGNIHVMILSMVIPLRVTMSLALGVMLLYVGVLFSGASPPFRMRSYARIYGYAAVANLLWMVPLMGGFLSIWCTAVICWHAVIIHHDLPRSRALMAVAPLVLGTLLFEFQGGF